MQGVVNIVNTLYTLRMSSIKGTLRGVELQQRIRSKVTPTAEGAALTFGFNLGPIAVFCIANLPEGDGENASTPLVYVKMTLTVGDGWDLFRIHKP